MFFCCSKQSSSFKRSLQTVEKLKSLSGTSNRQINTVTNKSNLVTLELDWTVIKQILKIDDTLISKWLSRLLWRYEVQCILKLANVLALLGQKGHLHISMFSISKRFNLLNLLIQQNTPSCFKIPWLPQSSKMVCYNMQQWVFYYLVLSAMKSFQLSATAFWASLCALFSREKDDTCVWVFVVLKSHWQRKERLSRRVKLVISHG